MKITESKVKLRSYEELTPAERAVIDSIKIDMTRFYDDITKPLFSTVPLIHGDIQEVSNRLAKLSNADYTSPKILERPYFPGEEASVYTARAARDTQRWKEQVDLAKKAARWAS